MERRFLPWAFGIAPVVLILLTWSGHDQNSGVKSYALPIVAVELATVVVAFREGMRFRLNAITACLAALLLIAWATAFIAPSPGVALFRTALWTLHLSFGFAAARLFRAEHLTEGLLVGFVVFVALLAVFVVTAPANFNWIYEMPGLGNPRAFALYAAAAIGLCLGLLAYGKIWASCISALAFALVFWSGSRGAMVVSSVALLTGLAFFPAVRRPAAWVPFVASAFVGGFVAWIIGSPTQLVGVTRIVDTTDNGRFYLWSKTIELISHRPWFGYGEAQLDYLSPMPWITHPHNIVLQVLLAWGIVGLALVICLSAWAGRRIFRNVDEEMLPLTIVIIVLAVYAQIDGAIYNVHTAAIFAACVGIVVRNGSRESLIINDQRDSEPSANSGGDGGFGEQRAPSIP